MLKKCISLLLVIICMLSLVACSNNDTLTTPVETTPFTEDSSIEVTVDDTEPILDENMMAEDLQNKTNGLYSITGLGFSFGSGTDNGIYMYLESITDSCTSQINLSNTDMPQYITDYKDYIYLDLTFDENGIASWQIVDKETKNPLENIEPEAMAEHFNVESNFREFKEYEHVAMGKVPEVLQLSELEFNKIYVYDIKLDKYNNFKLPELINDTEFPILEVWMKYQEDEYFDALSCKFKLNKSLETLSTTMALGQIENPKLYIVINEKDTNSFLEQNKSECVCLSNYKSKQTIESSFDDYIYNDTNKTYTLETFSMQLRESKTVTVLPGEIVEFDSDVTIKDIN